MKNLTVTLYMVLLTLIAATSNAQSKRSSRPMLFDNLPASIDFTESQLGNLFSLAKGRNTSLPIGNRRSLNGSVTSNQVKYANLQTVVIQLPAYNNALFSISKQTENNIITYVGRIMNTAYADGFELKRTAGGNYQLVKIDIQKTLTDCSL